MRSKCQHEYECAFAQKFNLQMCFQHFALSNVWIKESYFGPLHFSCGQRDLTCSLYHETLCV